MRKYRCKTCGYQGDEFVFQFDLYTYCRATNEEEPQYIDDAPDWVKRKNCGDGSIGQPVGCPKCHSWGVNNFEEVSTALTSIS